MCLDFDSEMGQFCCTKGYSLCCKAISAITKLLSIWGCPLPSGGAQRVSRLEVVPLGLVWGGMVPTFCLPLGPNLDQRKRLLSLQLYIKRRQAVTQAVVSHLWCVVSLFYSVSYIEHSFDITVPLFF